MGLHFNGRMRLALVLIAIMCGNWMFPLGVFSDPSAISDVKNRLSDISGKEKAIVEELFSMASAIQQMDNEIETIKLEIDTRKAEIEKKEALIEAEALSYEKIQNTLREVLKSRQRAGAASNLDRLLSAKDLKDLLLRINLLRDLSKNTSELMETIEAARSALAAEKQALKSLVADKEKQQEQLVAALADKKKAKTKLEAYLNGLQSDRGYYEGYLTSVQALWNTVKPTFAKTISSFRGIIETGALPDDTVRMSVSLLGAKGRIDQEKLNSVLSSRKDLPSLKFAIHPKRVTLEFPSERIVLSGEFLLIDAQTIKYSVKEGTFYGLPLSKEALKDLFSDGDLVFSLKALIGNNRIKRLDGREGYVELLVEIR